MRPVVATAEVRIDSCLSEQDERTLAFDVLDGLTRPFKEIPPKHFYDARGSELFEQICALPEYYPTRAEMAILRRHAGGIMAGVSELVELGSGAADKALMLLAAGAPTGAGRRYVPVDVSEQALVGAAAELGAVLPDLQIHGVVADFSRQLARLPRAGEGRRIIALLGGTIGNFPPGSRRALLRDIRAQLGPEDRLLLGVDLVKDVAVLEAAYDDSQGVTAEFNRNLLHVINRELGGDFVPESFDHVAFFDPRHEWIEMRLRSQRPCRVTLAALDLTVDFAAGEEMRTELSAKFTRARLEADLAAAGLALQGWMTDAGSRFALTLSGPSPRA